MNEERLKYAEIELKEKLAMEERIAKARIEANMEIHRMINERKKIEREELNKRVKLKNETKQFLEIEKVKREMLKAEVRRKQAEAKETIDLIKNVRKMLTPTPTVSEEDYDDYE
jgi:hypothetical protein